PDLARAPERAVGRRPVLGLRAAPCAGQHQQRQGDGARASARAMERGCVGPGHHGSPGELAMCASRGNAESTPRRTPPREPGAAVRPCGYDSSLTAAVGAFRFTDSIPPSRESAESYCSLVPMTWWLPARRLNMYFPPGDCFLSWRASSGAFLRTDSIPFVQPALSW